MGWESFGVIGFDLGLLLQDQMKVAKLKSANNFFFYFYFLFHNTRTKNKGFRHNYQKLYVSR